MNQSFQPEDTVAVVLKGSPLIGRLLSIKGSKAVVSFGGHRRDQDLPLRDLVPVVSSVDFRSQPVPTPEQVQTCSPSLRSLVEAWQLLVEDAPDGSTRLSLAEFCELLQDPPSLAGVAAIWTWLQSSQSLFRWRRDRLVQPLTIDERVRLRQQRQSARQVAQRQQRQLELMRLQQPWSEEERSELNRDWWDLIEHWVNLLHTQPAAVSQDPDLKRWSADFGIGADPADLRQWLVTKGLLDPHQPLSLRSSPWSTRFSDALVQEAERLVALAETELPGDAERLDLTHLACYSLDDAGTREIDDALSFERGDAGCWVWIHIADPARLIEPGSPLDQEAKRRATSLYLADGVMPMLPLPLAAGPLSLRAGVRSAALSVAVQLDDTGEVTAHRILRSWIRPRYGLTYADGDELIELAPPGDESLADLADAMNRRHRWRRSRGAVLFDRPEGRFRLRDNALDVQVIEPSASRLLVSEAMLLMGSVVAGFGQDHGLALPYRSQPPASLPTAEELEQIPDGPARDSAIKRCLSRGIQGTRPMPHFSLGLPAYVQATSPIRRYADLVAHRQILGQLHGGPVLTENELGELIEDLDDPLRQSIQISREDQRHWQQVWLARHREQRWSVIFLRWLRPQDRLALVHVPDLAMDLVGTAQGGDPTPGQTLTMGVTHVDPDRAELQLRFD